MIKVTIEKPESAKKLADLVITDLSILGMQLSHDERYLNFIFMLRTKEEKSFSLVKMIFLIGEDKDVDISYIMMPVHNTINIHKFPPEMMIRIRNIFTECNASNSFCCDFTPISMNKESATCIALQSSNGVSSYRNMIIPLSTYYLVNSLKTCILAKFPIDAVMDQDLNYKNMKFKIISKITFIGSASAKDKNDKGLLAHYIFTCSDGSVAGGNIPVSKVPEKIELKPIDDYNKFISFHKDQNNILRFRDYTFLSWEFDGELKNKGVMSFLIKNQNEYTAYIIDSNDIKNNLMTPYIDIYGG